MSRSLGTLTVDLVARYAGFEQGMTAAERVGERRARTIAENQRKYASESARAWQQMARDSGDSIESIGVKITRLGDQSANAAKIAQRAFAAVFAGASAASMIDTADTWGQYASRMEMATQSADEYNHAQQRMVESAAVTFRAVNETREGFIQMSPALRSMGLSLDQSIDAIDTFSGLLVVNSASADKGKNAMAALSTSLQKGKVDADAWNSIAGTMPTIVDALAEATGKTAAEIRALGVSGKVGINELVNTLVSQYEPTMKRVAAMPTSVADALGNLRNAYQEFIGQQNQALGVTSTLVDGINLLGGSFNTLAVGAIAAVTVGTARYAAGATFAAGASALSAREGQRKAAAELQDARAAVAATAAALAKVQAMHSLTSKTAQVTAATLAHEAAVKRLTIAQSAYTSIGRAALGILGGPAGLAISAGLVAMSFVAMGDKSEGAKSKLDELSGSSETLSAKLKELSRDQQKAALADATKQAADAAKEADSTFAGFVDTVARGFRDRLGHGITQELRQELDRARAAGGSLSEVIERFSTRAVIRPDVLSSWIQYAGRVSDSEQASKNAADRARDLAAAILGVQAATTGAGSGLQTYSEQAGKAIADLQKRVALFGKQNTGAEIRYELSLGDKGAYKDISPEQEKNLLGLADQLDAMKKREDAQKKYASASESAANQQKTQAAQYLKQLEDQLDKTQHLTVYEKLVSDLKRGVVKLSGEQLEKAQGLARQADEAKDKEKKRSDELERQNFLFEAQERLIARQQQYDLELSTYGMGDQAAADLRERIQLMQQHQAELRKLQSEQTSALAKANTKDEVQRVRDVYAERLQVIKDAQDKEVQMFEGTLERKRQKERDWASGAQSAFNTYVENAQNAYQQSNQFATKMLGGMEDALVNFAMTGKLNFKDFANSVIADLIRIQMQKAVVGFLGSVLGGFFGGGAAGAAGASGGNAAQGLKPGSWATGGYTGDGGKYEAAGVVHRGEVVWSQEDVARAGGVATVEAMRRGLRGYANGGPVIARAARPSTPGSSSGGMGGTIVNIHTAPGTTTEQTSRRGPGGAEIIDVFVKQAVGAVASQLSTDSGQIGQAMRARKQMGM
ncbi:phage tail tape measure protein [Comamonas sp. GB3 AK4-5]|uniref:phage tail tape measure protein n=1 Tax=Comamonas sp. GB3 AK4-5 TaxID=3231487 RepID=UPI00351F604F